MRSPAAAARFSVLLVSAAGLIGLNALAAGYYTAPMGVRVRHPFHTMLRPSGSLGLALGAAALILFLFLWVYPLRKKLGVLRGAGNIGGWLDWHIVAGLLVPWVAATHAGWRFNGLVGLAWIAMFIVHLSGIVGRYLYVHIPRKQSGVELTRDEAAGEREKTLFELVARTGLSATEVRAALTPAPRSGAGRSLPRALLDLVRDDFDRRRAARGFAETLRARGHDRSPELRRVLRLARREIALEQQVRALEATSRIFRWWHAAHRPFAIVAFGGVVVHVAVALAVGAARIP